MRPPVIRVGNNVYVLASTPLDKYTTMLNEVTKHVHLLASEAMDALDKAKLGPANTLLARKNDPQPGNELDPEDADALPAFMKFWEEAAGILGPFTGEFEEIQFEEGHGRDLAREQREDAEADEYELINPHYDKPSRYGSTLGTQLIGAYSYALGKLDSAVDALGKLLPLMHQWDAIAKETVTEDPGKAEELSDTLDKMMQLRDVGAKIADLVMSANYMALQPEKTQQSHASAHQAPRYKLVKFPRFIRIAGRLYRMDTEKTRARLIKEGAKAPPLTNWSSDSPSWDQDACKKRLKSVGGDFEACVEKSSWAKDPEGFCARLADCALDTTYWRGKGKKSPYKKESATEDRPEKLKFKGRVYLREDK